MASDVARAHRQALLRRSLGRAVAYLLLSAWSVIALVPFLWMVSGSLKDVGQIFRFPPTFIPNPVTFEGYQELIAESGLFVWARNSLYVAGFVTIGQLVSCSLAAYAFARIPFRARDKLFLVYLATMMIPGQVTMIPAYILIFKLRLVDSLEGLILPGVLGSPFGTFLLRQFFMTIPQELEDAALMDGAGHFTIYSRIILPLSKPALATLAVFQFMAVWNDFMWPLILIDSEARKTMPLGIAGMVYQNYTNWTLLMGAATLSLVPILLVFFAAQKYFVQGITLSGLKA